MKLVKCIFIAFFEAYFSVFNYLVSVI